MKKYTIEGGGFHNVYDINVRVGEPEYYGDGVEGWEMTPSQVRRIEKHFCGMNDCCCGSSPLVQIDYDRFVLPSRNPDN